VVKKKTFTVTKAASLIGVHRLTLYYWMKKKWINPKRDYRNWPVFTTNDINKIKKWRTRLAEV